MAALWASLLTGYEVKFAIGMVLSVICGMIIGAERELRGKPAGMSTNSFIIGAAMTFTFLAPILSPANPARVTSGIVSGIGFLGAGVIIKGKSDRISNLTTAASIWYSAAVGMVIGAGWYLITLFMVLFAIIVPRIPHVTGEDPDDIDEVK